MQGPSVDELDALDAICFVGNVSIYVWLEPLGHTKTPDWRVRMADGRVADIEVTTCTDEAIRSLFKELYAKDGSLKVWSDGRLSYRWIVSLVDRNPGINKKRRPLEKLVESLISALAAVEAAGGTPEGMESRAREAFDGSTLVSRPSEDTITLTDFPGLQINDGCFSQLVHLNHAPDLVGPGRGSVILVPHVSGGGAGWEQLASGVQDAIYKKTKKQQMDDAPDLKWLVVMVYGLPGWQLTHHFGPHSRALSPTLDGITFDYFDGVWVVSKEVVLRLSDGRCWHRDIDGTP